MGCVAHCLQSLIVADPVQGHISDLEAQVCLVQLVVEDFAVRGHNNLPVRTLRGNDDSLVCYRRARFDRLHHLHKLEQAA